MITDFFGKKRGRKRKIFSKLPKNKSLYGSSRKTKSIILQDCGEVDRNNPARSIDHTYVVAKTIQSGGLYLSRFR